MDVDEREWVWWNGTNLENAVKIDLSATSYPFSLGALTFVVEAAGGIIFYNDRWLSQSEAVKLAQDSKVDRP